MISYPYLLRLSSDAEENALNRKTKNDSQHLLNSLFNHPYSKIKFVMRDVGVLRATANRYLEQLVVLGILEKRKIRKTNYYTNTALLGLFQGQTEEVSSSFIDSVKL